MVRCGCKGSEQVDTAVVVEPRGRTDRALMAGSRAGPSRGGSGDPDDVVVAGEPAAGQIEPAQPAIAVVVSRMRDVDRLDPPHRTPASRAPAVPPVGSAGSFRRDSLHGPSVTALRDVRRGYGRSPRIRSWRTSTSPTGTPQPACTYAGRACIVVGSPTTAGSSSSMVDSSSIASSSGPITLAQTAQPMLEILLMTPMVWRVREIAGAPMVIGRYRRPANPARSAVAPMLYVDPGAFDVGCGVGPWGTSLRHLGGVTGHRGRAGAGRIEPNVGAGICTRRGCDVRPINAQDMVGAAGFEPTTTSPPDWCATRLRHAPTGVEV